jgi:hypothetical protein
MAKKQTKKTQVEQPEVKAANEMTQVVIEKAKPKKDTWEIKDRVYTLKGRRKPLSRTIRASHIYYFDEEKGYERELKNTANQKTCFVDEMIGDQRLEHIIFRNGILFVPKNKVVLQKLLSLYHPHLNKIYEEVDNNKKAEDDLNIIDAQLEAMNAASTVSIDIAEAILRVEKGSRVSEMSSKELKRDLLIFARNNPILFLELLNDDNVGLRNVGIKAAELNIITLSQDQRTFTWTSTGRKLMTVPFDENPYSALAAWFKTDEGVEVYSSIEKRLK